MAKLKQVKISIGTKNVAEVAKTLGFTPQFVYRALAGNSQSENSLACVDFVKKNYPYKTVITEYSI